MHEEMNECATTHNTVSCPTLLQINARNKQDVSQGSSCCIYNTISAMFNRKYPMRADSNGIVSERYSVFASNVIMCDP